MFVRYSIAASAAEIAAKFSVDVPEGYKPIFNAAPTHLLPVVTQDSQQGVSFFYWGAPPSWANKKALGEKIINTRAEQFAEKAADHHNVQDAGCRLRGADFRGRVAIALGSEAHGLSDRWHDAGITAICLPLLGSVDSLNLSATAAVLFYEALRQRQAK